MIFLFTSLIFTMSYQVPHYDGLEESRRVAEGNMHLAQSTHPGYMKTPAQEAALKGMYVSRGADRTAHHKIDAATLKEEIPGLFPAHRGEERLMQGVTRNVWNRARRARKPVKPYDMSTI